MSILQTDSGPTAVDQLFARTLIDIGIPPCPLILNTFMTEARRDDNDFHDLERILRNDVGLSASLIKTANSPYFGLRQPVRSVHSALTILGLKASACAVAGIVLRNAFPKAQNLERFWDGSARISRLSGWLALRLDIRGLRADDAYTFGLFRDCGIAVLISHIPGYQKLLGTANAETERSFVAVEQAEVQTNHAAVGSLMAQSWWLPEEISLAIASHHDLQALGSEESTLPLASRRLIAAAQISEHIVQRRHRLSLTQEWSKLGAACLKTLGLTEQDLETLYAESAAGIPQGQ
jgi:HD-like signal output (HDOD) protein